MGWRRSTTENRSPGMADECYDIDDLPRVLGVTRTLRSCSSRGSFGPPRPSFLRLSGPPRREVHEGLVIDGGAHATAVCFDDAEMLEAGAPIVATDK